MGDIDEATIAAIDDAVELSRPAWLHVLEELLLAEHAINRVIDGGPAFEEARRLYRQHRSNTPEEWLARPWPADVTTQP